MIIILRIFHFWYLEKHQKCDTNNSFQLLYDWHSRVLRGSGIALPVKSEWIAQNMPTLSFLSKYSHGSFLWFEQIQKQIITSLYSLTESLEFRMKITDESMFVKAICSFLSDLMGKLGIIDGNGTELLLLLIQVVWLQLYFPCMVNDLRELCFT